MQGALSKPHLYWAFSILLSRLVRLPTLRNVEALCPWADMINHDCRASSHLDFDLASQTASLISDRSYSPGEQVEAPASNYFGSLNALFSKQTHRIKALAIACKA